MSAPVGASLLKGWKGNGDLGLSLCSCCLAACGESSMKSICRTDNHEVGENCGIVDEAQSECTTREDSTFAQFPFSNGTRSSPSSGWRGIDTVISQISRDSSRNNGGVVEQVGNRKGLGKLRSSQYKGVLAQRNGRWGAQIYEKHRRVWLGTFNTEEDAAQSYDTAALKFRGRKAITNFNPIEDTHPEATFLRCHSKAEIVDMLRTHTYREELHDSYKMNGAESNGSSNHDGSKVTGGKPIEGESAAYPRVHLFEKALTPSDVGKLNRLVIPKLHAQRWLPLELASRDKGVTLNCQDATGKLWRFRYSYWNSSQSFVLTKGWCRYTKGKRLQAGDTVIFEHSTGDLRQLYISFRRRPCNIFKQKADFCTLPVHPMLATPLPVCSQSTDEFHSQPPIQDRSIISKGLIPSLSPTNSSSAFDIYSLHSSIKSASEKRNSWPLEYAHPRSKELSSSISPNSSSVTVFGVNLSLDVCTVLPH